MTDIPASAYLGEPFRQSLEPEPLIQPVIEDLPPAARMRGESGASKVGVSVAAVVLAGTGFLAWKMWDQAGCSGQKIAKSVVELAQADPAGALKEVTGIPNCWIRDQKATGGESYGDARIVSENVISATATMDFGLVAVAAEVPARMDIWYDLLETRNLLIPTLMGDPDARMYYNSTHDGDKPDPKGVVDVVYSPCFGLGDYRDATPGLTAEEVLPYKNNREFLEQTNQQVFQPPVDANLQDVVKDYLPQTQMDIELKPDPQNPALVGSAVIHTGPLFPCFLHMPNTKNNVDAWRKPVGQVNDALDKQFRYDTRSITEAYVFRETCPETKMDMTAINRKVAQFGLGELASIGINVPPDKVTVVNGDPSERRAIGEERLNAVRAGIDARKETDFIDNAGNKQKMRAPKWGEFKVVDCQVLQAPPESSVAPTPTTSNALGKPTEGGQPSRGEVGQLTLVADNRGGVTQARVRKVRRWLEPAAA